MKDDIHDDNSLPSNQTPPVPSENERASHILRIGKAPPQAPAGTHIAKVVHVDTNWTFLGNRKVCIHLEIVDGPFKGSTARKFYRLKLRADGEWEIAPKSQLAKDIRRLFPIADYSDKVEGDTLNIVQMFIHGIFDIAVERKKAKDGEINAIVIHIERHDCGF